jgi:hypothetical protein
MNLFNKEEVQSFLPKKIFLKTSNGEFDLKHSDFTIAPPQFFISYHHSTPEKTGDVLTDGEPDYLGFDVQMIQQPPKCKCDVTYGDAMMFSFDILSDGKVKVGHYNGYGSKFDSKYEFFFHEDTIGDLIDFFTKLTGFNLGRDQFNFLDGDKNSFKMEKVNHPRIVDFKSFNLLDRL